MEHSNKRYIEDRYKLNGKDMVGLHSLRYKVFYKKLGWMVPTQGDLEIDSYDALNPVYIIHKKFSEVVGCARLLPTLGPYMLRDTFPQMLRGEAAPESAEIMEISRFAVDGRYSTYKKQSTSYISYSLLRGLYFYAQNLGIKRYVMVTTVSIERYLRRIKVQTERFGDREATMIDKDACVALKLEVNESFRNAVLDS